MPSKATKAGIGYTVANVFVRGIGFLTLPVFSRVLDTYDFGVYNVFLAYDAILFCVIGFALHSSVKSANWEFPGKVDEYVSSALVLYVGNAALLLALALAFGPWFAETLGLDVAVIACMVLHSFGSAVVAMYNARVSLQYSYLRYMVVAAASSVGNVALSLLLIFTVLDKWRYMGRILGATLALFLLGIALVLYFWWRSRPRASTAYWCFGMRYSLPIMAHGLSQVALVQIGRLMTNYMVSTAAAGVYGLIANLSTIFAVLADSVGTVWTTWFYETMEGETAGEATGVKSLSEEECADRGRTIRRRADQLSLLFAVVAVALMAVAPEMIWVLGGDAYMDGALCAFGVILSGYCVFLYNLICVGEYYKQKTGYIMAGTAMAAVLNIVLNFWGISLFGYVAAAYTTLASYVCYVAFHWAICHRLMGFSILGLGQTLSVGCGLLALAIADALLLGNPLARFVLGAMACAVVVHSLVRDTGGFRGALLILRR